jgi:hypothetical protein
MSNYVLPWQLTNVEVQVADAVDLQSRSVEGPQPGEQLQPEGPTGGTLSIIKPCTLRFAVLEVCCWYIRYTCTVVAARQLGPQLDRERYICCRQH